MANKRTRGTWGRRSPAHAVRRGAVAAGAEAEARAKLFWNGRSQAVRLPKAFRFDGKEVLIRREGERVILEPVGKRRGWPKGYWERLSDLAKHFEGFEVPEPLPPGGTDVDLDVP